MRAMHHSITFDDLPAGTVVTEQYPGVRFSSPGVANVVIANADQIVVGGPEPNALGGPAPNLDDLYIDFDPPVINLKFLVNGAGPSGVIARVRVLCGGVQSITDIIANGSSFSTVDLSEFKVINRIEIFDITDVNGIGFDDFQFDDVARIEGTVSDADGN
jgi:hypothetical protein